MFTWTETPAPQWQSAPGSWGAPTQIHCFSALLTPTPPSTQAAQPGVHGKPQRGSPTPHGATVTSAGAVNFAVFSSGATAVSLIFADAASGQVTGEIALDPALNRTACARLL